MTSPWEFAEPRIVPGEIWGQVVCSDEPPLWAKAKADQVLAAEADTGDVTCDLCGADLAFVLEMRENTYGAEYEVMEWSTPWLVLGVDGVSVLCEDCLEEDPS
jgi:hypothetical protein